MGVGIWYMADSINWESFLRVSLYEEACYLGSLLGPLIVGNLHMTKEFHDFFEETVPCSWTCLQVRKKWRKCLVRPFPRNLPCHTPSAPKLELSAATPTVAVSSILSEARGGALTHTPLAAPIKMTMTVLGEMMLTVLGEMMIRRLSLKRPSELTAARRCQAGFREKRPTVISNSITLNMVAILRKQY